VSKDKKTERLLTRGVDEIIVESHLKEVLKSGKKLRVKLGIDPTAPDLHLGHTVVLRKLREFQDAGHKAVLIIGDFTAQIGDPSGRSEERKPLKEKEIKENMKKYLDQAGKVIDIKKTEIRHNNDWHGKEGLKKMLELMRSTSVQQILKRDDFQKRLSEDAEISLLETVYPLLQGYDSVEVKADVELGGTDQKFNLLVGRRVQRHFGTPEQDILTVPLIEGTDGKKKMSKSAGNYIAINEEPNEMFGKIMSIPDTLLGKYFETLTDIDIPENEKPRNQKLLLAETIVETYHSKKEAEAAREEFLRVFSKKEAPENIPEETVNKEDLEGILSQTHGTATVITVKLGVAKNWSEAKRLVEQGAFRINDEVKKDPKEIFDAHNGDIVRIGPRKFFKLKIEQ